MATTESNGERFAITTAESMMRDHILAYVRRCGGATKQAIKADLSNGHTVNDELFERVLEDLTVPKLARDRWGCPAPVPRVSGGSFQPEVLEDGAPSHSANRDTDD